ncbi:MAG: hypothetical protein V4723_00155 [Pseudomonadota bacterium]
MQIRPEPLYRNAPFYFALLLLTALVGFFPSFYSRIGEAKFTHLLHGGVATLWMLLLIGQSWLVRQRQLRWHRAIGKASVLLVVLFAIGGVMIDHDMLTRSGGFAKAFGHRLFFLDMMATVYFVVAYALAIHNRHNVQLHARFMASTALLLLPPALARVLGFYVLPEGSSFALAFHLGFAISSLVVLALMLHDYHSGGKVRAPYLILLAVMLVQQASYEVLPRLDAWMNFVGWLRSLS